MTDTNHDPKVQPLRVTGSLDGVVAPSRDEQVEVVARAIAQVWGHAPETWNISRGYNLPQVKRKLFRDAARAAIAAYEAAVQERG